MKNVYSVQVDMDVNNMINPDICITLHIITGNVVLNETL